MSSKAFRPIEILLIEDSPSDANLTIKALAALTLPRLKARGILGSATRR
jgi:hypothetical protein